MELDDDALYTVALEVGAGSLDLDELDPAISDALMDFWSTEDPPDTERGFAAWAAEDDLLRTDDYGIEDADLIAEIDDSD